MHGCGLVHRDVKPSTVLLDKKGWQKICDLGVAIAAKMDDEPDDIFVGTNQFRRVYKPEEICLRKTLQSECRNS